MGTVAKRKISVTVDADLVHELEAAGENLSGRINAALRNDLAARQRQRALGEFLDRLDHERGPLDTAEDKAEISRFMQLLSGAPE